ncbi:MAG: hypothetical protein KDK07_14180 [Bauldia sp.]|nr:hypothetical protein [Bauldia sp.]
MSASVSRAAVAVVLIAGGLSPAAGQSSEPTHLECAGPFGADSSEALLRQVFGDDHIRDETIDGPEGTTLDATLVFPDDPERRLIVLWWDEAARTRPAAIIIREDSNWMGPGGVHLGAALTDVEAINGAPFALLGFGWDYGGAASFPEGALAEIPGGCVLSLSFDLDWTRDFGPEFDAIMGDQQIPSSDSVMRSADPRVSEIAVGYPE